MSSKMGPSSQRGSVPLDLHDSRMWFSKCNQLCSHFCISYYFSLSHAETKDNNLTAKYHPNFWMDGKWRCCQQTEKLAAGCHVYDPLGFGSYSLFLFCVFNFKTNREMNTFCVKSVSNFSTASKKPLPQLPDPKVDNLLLSILSCAICNVWQVLCFPYSLK